MTSQFAAAFFKMGLLGQEHNHNVSKNIVLILNTDHARDAQMIDCSSVIPQPPPLDKYKIEFPPGQYYNDVEQSVSLP